MVIRIRPDQTEVVMVVVSAFLEKMVKVEVVEKLLLLLDQEKEVKEPDLVVNMTVLH